MFGLLALVYQVLIPSWIGGKKRQQAKIISKRHSHSRGWLPFSVHELRLIIQTTNDGKFYLDDGLFPAKNNFK